MHLSAISSYIRTDSSIMTKVHSHIIPDKIPVKFLQNLWENGKLRGASRLYMCIRRFIGGKFHRGCPIETETLRKLFPVHGQIDRYLKILVKHKMMRKDKKGDYYITNIRNLVTYPDYGAEYYVAVDKNGNGYVALKKTKKQSLGTEEKPAKRRRVYTKVEDARLLNAEDWKSYLAAIYQCSYACSIKHGKTRKSAMRHAATNDPNGVVLYRGQLTSSSILANSSMSQGCANTCISKKMGCHKSTASRHRKLGVKSGLYETARWFEGREFQHIDFETRVISEYGDAYADPNRFVYIDGRILYERATQIVMATDIFFSM